MKNFLLALVFLSAPVFSQSKSEWFVKANTNIVYDLVFNTGVHQGLGGHIGLRPWLDSGKKIQPSFLIGLESMPGSWFSSVPAHFWYHYNFRFTALLEREVWQVEHKSLLLGLGASVFAGDLITGKGSVTFPDGNITRSNTQDFEGAFSLQLSLRYQNLVFSDRLSFGHAIDYVIARDFLIQSLSVYWKLTK